MAVPPSDPAPAVPSVPSGGAAARVSARAGSAPRAVVAAAALTALEAVALVGYAVAYTFQVLPLGADAGTKALVAGGVVVVLLVFAVGLIAAAWSLLGLKRWPLSLVVVAQLVAIPVLLPVARGELPVLWVAIAAAVVVIVLAFLPSTTAAVTR